MLLMAAAAFVGSSCENDNINPYEYNNNDSNQNQGSTEVLKTKIAEYPVGSVVWTKDTTLTESVEIPVGTSLYIEPGVTVTCKSDVQVPIEIVVLGNLYCMGTTEHPVTFTSDTKKTEDWGGIICDTTARRLCSTTWIWLMPEQHLPNHRHHSKTTFSRALSMVACLHSTSAT